jgi:hypothetical protein
MIHHDRLCVESSSRICVCALLAGARDEMREAIGLIIDAIRADEREQAAQRIENLGCGDVCGCSITIPSAAAAVRGES